MTDNQQPKSGIGEEHTGWRLRKSHIWLGVILIVLLVAFRSLFGSEPLEISKQTTYVTGPLTTDGEQIDYFAVIEQIIGGGAIATDKNGYRLIVQHLGNWQRRGPEQFSAILQKLGLAADALQADVTFEDQWDFLKRYVTSDRFDDALLDDLPHAVRSPLGVAGMLDTKLDRAWTLSDLPMMAEWLEANGPALDLVGRAVRRPVFQIPLVDPTEDVFVDVVTSGDYKLLRSFARGLGTRANYRIAVGEINGAIEDIIACKRLGRHVGRGPSFFDMKFGMAIEGIADNSIEIAGATQHPPTREELQHLQEEIDKLPSRADIEEIVLMSRFLTLHVVQSLASGKKVGTVFGIDRSPTRYVTALSLDWNIVAERINERFDSFAAEKAQPVAVSFGPRILFSRRARSEHLADVLSNAFVSFEFGAQHNCGS